MAQLPSWRGDRGQVVPIAALLMIVIVGFAALILDGGRGYVDRRDLQAAADTAALSGSRLLGPHLLSTNFHLDCAVAAAVNQAVQNLPGTSTPGAYSYTPSCPTLSNSQFRYSATNIDLGNHYKMDVSATTEQVMVTLHHTLDLTFGIAAGFGPSVTPGATATAVNGNLPFALVLFRNNTDGNGIGDPTSNLKFGGSQVTLSVNTTGSNIADAVSNEGICPKSGNIDFHSSGDQYTFATPGIPGGGSSCGSSSNILNPKIGGDPISFPLQLPDPRLPAPSQTSAACTITNPCNIPSIQLPTATSQTCLAPGVYTNIDVKKGTLILEPGVFEITGSSTNNNANSFHVGGNATVTTEDNLNLAQVVASSGCPVRVPAAGSVPVSVIMDPVGSQGSLGNTNQLLVDSGGTFNVYSGPQYNNIALYVSYSPTGDPCYYNNGSVNNPSSCGSSVINFASGALYSIKGLVYGYGDNMTFASAQTAVNAIGQTFAWTLTIVGNGSLSQTYDPALTPFLQGLLK